MYSDVKDTLIYRKNRPKIIYKMEMVMKKCFFILLLLCASYFLHSMEMPLIDQTKTFGELVQQVREKREQAASLYKQIKQNQDTEKLNEANKLLAEAESMLTTIEWHRGLYENIRTIRKAFKEQYTYEQNQIMQMRQQLRLDDILPELNAITPQQLSEFKKSLDAEPTISQEQVYGFVSNMQQKDQSMADHPENYGCFQ